MRSFGKAALSLLTIASCVSVACLRNRFSLDALPITLKLPNHAVLRNPNRASVNEFSQTLTWTGNNNELVPYWIIRLMKVCGVVTHCNSVPEALQRGHGASGSSEQAPESA